MSSRRFFPAGLFRRAAFHALGWGLLCFTLRDAVPSAWAWTALPAAVILGTAAFSSRLRTVFAAAILAAFPWLVRLVFLAASSSAGSDLIAAFDDGWLLTAPFWYFSAAAMLLVGRRPALGYAEAFLLAAFCAAVLVRDDDWGSVLTAPVAASLKLAAAVAVLVLAALCFAAARKRTALRRSGSVGPAFRRPGASDLAHAAVLAAALVLLFIAGNRMRRESSLSAGGGVLASDLFHFDFNDVLSLEPEISMDGELTMLYREDGPPVPRYLRRYTLSGWDPERGFYRDGEREKDFPGRDAVPVALPKSPKSWPEAGFESRATVAQEYYLVALDPESFFALDYPVSVEPWVIWDDASFTRAYAAESRVSLAEPWDLYSAGTGGLAGSERAYYLKGGDDPYFVELAEEVAGDRSTPWSKARAVEEWFHDEFYYSLEPGLAPDGDQLSWFLEETRRGYCSYFAFGMTRVCRAAGIPARVAVGFLTDPAGATLGFVPVRSDQAHAWVEVWFDDHGWVTFDPTTDVMAPGEEYPVRFISPEEWLPLVEEVLTRSGEVSVAVEEVEDEEDAGGAWSRVVRLALRRPVFSWVVLILFFAALYAPGRIVPGLVLAAASRSKDSRTAAKARWRRFARLLIRSGWAPGRKETPSEWSSRMEASGLPGFSGWTDAYLKAVFSPVFGGSDAEGAERAERLTRESWNRMPRSRRCLAVMGLGWKGALPW